MSRFSIDDFSAYLRFIEDDGCGRLAARFVSRRLTTSEFETQLSGRTRGERARVLRCVEALLILSPRVLTPAQEACLDRIEATI